MRSTPPTSRRRTPAERRRVVTLSPTLSLTLSPTLTARLSFRLSVALAIVLLPVALATTYLELELPLIIEQADLAFVGTVERVEVEARDGVPWTVVTLLADEPLFGVEEGDEVTLSFLGGTLPDGSSLSVNLMPQFSAGERLLIMAYDREAYSPIVGFRQGLWRQGDLGFSDEEGRLLSLDDAGALAADGLGADSADLLGALRSAFEERP